MKDLTPSQKAKLHEVADGMLKVYQTLVRMRYLDASLIQEGPHNVDHLLPLYRSLGLDPSIIYLYSILPYVKPGDDGGGGDFFQGGEFADFRDEEDVRQARDPFYSDAAEDAMRPWMTPLSNIGNHHTALIYDARKHCIGIFDQLNSGSGDHNLYEGCIIRKEDEVDEEEGDQREGHGVGSGGSAGGEPDETDEEEDGVQSDEEDGQDDHGDDEDEEEAEDEQGDEGGDSDDDEDSGDDDGGHECWLDEMDCRPAPNVLRDMVLWFESLTELPGGGEQSGPEWSADIIKPLYIKHGWPHAHFNGDAFLVDQARAQAVLDARDAAQEPQRKVDRLHPDKGTTQNADDDGSNSPLIQRGRERLAAATTPDEEWAARWELWRAECGHKRRLRAFREAEADLQRECPDGVCVKPGEMVLWELRQLREELLSAERALKRCRQEINDAGETDDDARRSLQIQLRQAERRAETYRRAYEACEADAKRDCPGKAPLPLGRGVETTGLDLDGRRKDLTGQVEGLEEDIGLIREWIEGLPEGDGVQTARELAGAQLEQSEEQLESTKWQLGCVMKDLEGL
ncbi:hypothetical protein VFPBJ_00147 [Purpureocillium lilacinum]|uniref:Uncharacterized protein n=1 Tax=Purpureocillium lilacinum TaxID=33203 RepID=A0A179H7F9_PURLI|nr:hypothetical protein VFPBJ_00147 [Purpureocillium lilacinum]